LHQTTRAISQKTSLYSPPREPETSKIQVPEYLTVAQLIKNLPTLMAPVGSLLYSQEPATIFSHVNPLHITLSYFFTAYFNIILIFMQSSYK
jgi:hypothetical protein